MNIQVCKARSLLNNLSISDCQISCTFNSSCSVATFNSNPNSCTLSSGTGNIVPTRQSTSIAQDALYYNYPSQQIIHEYLIYINNEWQQQIVIVVNFNKHNKIGLILFVLTIILI